MVSRLKADNAPEYGAACQGRAAGIVSVEYAGYDFARREQTWNRLLFAIEYLARQLGPQAPEGKGETTCHLMGIKWPLFDFLGEIGFWWRGAQGFAIGNRGIEIGDGFGQGRLR